MDRLRILNQAKTSLIAFEAAARHLSFIKAARELNVTQPAISRSIARLENILGTRLFLRSARGNILSADGETLFHTVSDSYRRLEEVLENISKAQNDLEIITLSVSTAMVNLWFIPRMESLQKQFPNVDFRFQMISGEPTGSIGDIDLGVRLNRFADQNDYGIILSPEIIVPVSSNDYCTIHKLEKFRPKANNLTFLNYNAPRINWEDFFGDSLYKSFINIKSITFSDYAVILQAAMAGKGIALGWAHLITEQIKAGTLVICGNKALRTGENYLITTARISPPKLISDIREWMLVEMQRDNKALEMLDFTLED